MTAAEIDKMLLRNQADIMIGLATLINEESRRRNDPRLIQISKTLLERASETKDAKP